MSVAIPVSHRTVIRVRYADTDQMHIVYNAKYLEYFEVGRTELLRSLGLPYAELEKTGARLPLVEARCIYIAPALYDDLLEVESTVEHYESPRLHIDYTIRRVGDDRIIARGSTTHAWQSIPSGKVIRPPQQFLLAMAGHGMPDNG